MLLFLPCSHNSVVSTGKVDSRDSVSPRSLLAGSPGWIETADGQKKGGGRRLYSYQRHPVKAKGREQDFSVTS